MNYCHIHQQSYSDFCVYCGPPKTFTTGGIFRDATSHVCIPGDITSGGQTCVICGKSIPPAPKPQIYCDGEPCVHVPSVWLEEDIKHPCSWSVATSDGKTVYRSGVLGESP